MLFCRIVQCDFIGFDTMLYSHISPHFSTLFKFTFNVRKRKEKYESLGLTDFLVWSKLFQNLKEKVRNCDWVQLFSSLLISLRTSKFSNQNYAGCTKLFCRNNACVVRKDMLDCTMLFCRNNACVVRKNMLDCTMLFCRNNAYVVRKDMLESTMLWRNNAYVVWKDMLDCTMLMLTYLNVHQVYHVHIAVFSL